MSTTHATTPRRHILREDTRQYALHMVFMTGTLASLWLSFALFDGNLTRLGASLACMVAALTFTVWRVGRGTAGKSLDRTMAAAALTGLTSIWLLSLI